MNIQQILIADLDNEQKLNVIAAQFANLYRAFEAVCPAGVCDDDRTAHRLAQAVLRKQPKTH